MNLFCLLAIGWELLSIGNCFVHCNWLHLLSVGHCYFHCNWLHLLSVGHCFGQELQIEQEKRKGEKKKKPKNAAIEKPNVQGFSRVSKCNPKMVYSRVLNTSLGPGYNRILNAAQSGSVAVFCISLSL